MILGLMRMGSFEDAIEKKKEEFDKKGIDYVELSIDKPDGNKFRMIIKKEAFLKMPQTKLRILKRIM